MAEGQIDPRRQEPAVLSYAAGASDPTDPEWHTLEGGVELVVPAPAVWRQLLMIVIELAGSAAMTVLAVSFVAAAARSEEVAVLVIVLVLAVSLSWWAGAIRRLVRVARQGTLPTVVQTLPSRLALMSPWLPTDGPLEVPTASITGIRLTGEGLPPLIEFLRLRVVLRGDKLVTVRFPWRGGGESVVSMEHRLRAALGFGPRNFSRESGPRVPAKVQTPRA